MRKLVGFTILALLSACGGASEQAESTTPEGESSPPPDAVETPDSGGEGAGAAEAAARWAELDRDGRLALMREQVMPRMGAMFREFDGEEFATFTCATCHGEGFQEVDFRMPNGLHPLNPAEIPGMAESEDEEVARFARFMFGQVTPGMVEILGVEPYDPATHEGFGCLSCHARAE